MNIKVEMDLPPHVLTDVIPGLTIQSQLPETVSVVIEVKSVGSAPIANSKEAD